MSNDPIYGPSRIGGRLREAHQFAHEMFERFDQIPTPDQIETLAERLAAQFDFLDHHSSNKVQGHG